MASFIGTPIATEFARLPIFDVSSLNNAFFVELICSCSAVSLTVLRPFSASFACAILFLKFVKALLALLNSPSPLMAKPMLIPMFVSCVLCLFLIYSA